MKPTIEGKEIEKLYFQMGEVEQILNEPAPNIRFWIREFALNVKRSHGDKRFFTQDDIDNLKEIKRLLKAEQYTLKGAKVKFVNHADIHTFAG